MALKITPTSVEIQNSDGTPKFNSQNALLYQRFYAAQNNVTLNNTTNVLTFNLGVDSVDEAKAVLVSARIVSADGNAASALVGQTIPISGTLLTHIDYTVSGTTTYMNSEFLSAFVYGPVLKVAMHRLNYDKDISAPNTYVTVDFYVRYIHFTS